MRPEPFEGLAGSDGVLDRRLAGRAVFVPGIVEIDGPNIVWSITGQDRWIRVSGGRAMFEAFVGLGDASAEKILAFARRWGPLMICRHDFFAFHDSGFVWPGWSPPESTGSRCGLLPHDDIEFFCEAIDSWRLWASRAKASLNVAAKLLLGKMPSDSDWRVACGLAHPHSAELEWEQPTTIGAAWDTIGNYIDFWLRMTRARAMFEATAQRRRITFGGPGGLFPTIALELALTMSRTEGLAICCACGRAYVPERKPRPDRRHYCENCRGQGFPGRNASADYRARRREAMRLHHQGLGLREISAEVGVKSAVIRGWIERGQEEPRRARAARGPSITRRRKTPKHRRGRLRSSSK